MGEPTTLRATFRPSLRVEAGDGCLSSFGGVAYLREFEERTGILRELLGDLEDPRSVGRSTHGTAAMLRLALYGRVLGFPDVTDADHLRFEPGGRTVSRTIPPTWASASRHDERAQRRHVRGRGVPRAAGSDAVVAAMGPAAVARGRMTLVKRYAARYRP